MSRGDCEAFLTKWITQYVTLDDQASAATKAQFPLREARIEVSEVPGKPGVYRAIAFLRPHFQLDELTVSLRLVAELPQAAKK
jgi:type VI secretion system protein ImpC